MTDAAAIQKTQLTQEGHDEIVKELKELETVKLPAVIARVEVARQNGDLSENAEYTNAKEDQEFTETRINDLKAILANATIVQHTTKRSVAGIGSVITVKIKNSKRQQKFQICGEFEADPSENKISSVSPLGKALMGKKKGDEVSVKAPSGLVVYQVVDVE